MKKYGVGFYGGKFMPFHRGHLSCVEQMSAECEKAYLLLFVGGAQENEIHKSRNDDWLTVQSRKEAIERVAKMFDNVIPMVVDVSSLTKADGTEDWDGETPLVRAICGNKIDAVYSSELAYDDYFKRAYPEAEHRIVDVDRTKFNISGTKVREMESEEERKKWVI